MGFKGSIFISIGLFCTLLVPPSLTAQEVVEVEVSQQVRFNHGARPPGGGARWLEVQVPINVRGSADASTKFNSHYVDDIKAVVMVAFEVGSGSKKSLRYYRSQMEIATLPRGRHILRFYLPAAVVERDRLHGEPLAHAVQLFAEGRQQPWGRNGRSGFTTEAAFFSFLQRMETEGARTDGILVPIYLSPFADAYPRDSFSFVRRTREF
jgi:hypothetical protein